MSQLDLDTAQPLSPFVATWLGYIASPRPDEIMDRCRVIIPAMNPDLVFEDVRWMARDSVQLPAVGDACLVQFDNNREPWVITWWPNWRSPQTTDGVIDDGPPDNPTHGDIWSAFVSNGVRWQFFYNEFSASPYKWEFAGGAPLTAYIETVENVVAAFGGYGNMATVGPSVSVAREGDYDMSIFMGQVQSGTITQWCDISTVIYINTVGNWTNPIIQTFTHMYPQAGINLASAYAEGRANIPANAVLRPAYGVASYYQTGGQPQVGRRRISVKPVRIS